MTKQTYIDSSNNQSFSGATTLIEQRVLEDGVHTLLLLTNQNQFCVVTADKNTTTLRVTKTIHEASMIFFSLKQQMLTQEFNQKNKSNISRPKLFR